LPKREGPVKRSRRRMPRPMDGEEPTRLRTRSGAGVHRQKEKRTGNKGALRKQLLDELEEDLR